MSRSAASYRVQDLGADPCGSRRQPKAHNTMADYFFSDGRGISAVIMALADAFYEAAIDQQTDV